MSKINTRERIVETADQLFYEVGFEATSFADVAATVGISRGNFYHHFKSKDDILEAVIDRRLHVTQEMLQRWKDNSQTPQERIICFIRILIVNRSKIMAYGCPVGTLSSELAKLEHHALHRAADIFAMFRIWLAEAFKEMGQNTHADNLSLHLLGRSQGIAIMATAFRDEAFIRAEVEALESWLHSLQDDRERKEK